jgi:quercetin dioxygenase-like cupin family protein
MNREQPPFRVLSLLAEETVQARSETPPWIPLRRRLGIEAFGTNAFRATRAGEPVVEDHVESPGQEELYVVVAGRVRFTVDGAEIDAAAGEVLFVPDPERRRGGVALEDGTLVLAVGGWPGRAYHSLPWEPLYLAQESMRTGDWSGAAEILEREAGEHIDRPIVRYRLACCYAQADAHDRALQALRRAIDLDPGMRERAANDDLLEPLRASAEWRGLVAQSGSPRVR